MDSAASADDVKAGPEAPSSSLLDALQGAAGKLPAPLSWREMRAIAYEDRLFNQKKLLNG